MAKHPCKGCIYFKQCGCSTRAEQCKGRNIKVNVVKFRNNGIGEVSSKYGYDRDGSQFEADIKANQERAAALYADFVEWMKTKDVSPDAFRYMFTRYYEEFMK